MSRLMLEQVQRWHKRFSEMPAVTQVISEEEIQVQATGDRTTGDILAQLIPSLGASSGSTSNYGT